jgi:L-iditol 2-dehydrogenase
VLVAGLLDNRLRVALQLGADVAINVQKEDLFSNIEKLTNGIGVDIVILAIGAPEAIVNAFKLVRKGGKIVFFAGIYTQSPLIDLNLIHSRSLKIIGSVDFTPREFLQALEIMKNKKIQIKPLISHIMPLDKIQEAFEIVEKLKGLKVLIDPWM